MKADSSAPLANGKYPYRILPSITGFEFHYDNNQSLLLREDNQIDWTDDERKTFEDEANNGGEAKF